MAKGHIRSTIEGKKVDKEIYFRHGVLKSIICHFSDKPIVKKGEEYRLGVLGKLTTIDVICESIDKRKTYFKNLNRFTYTFKHF